MSEGVAVPIEPADNRKTAMSAGLHWSEALAKADEALQRAIKANHPSLMASEVTAVRVWIAKAERIAHGKDLQNRPWSPLRNYGVDELAEELRRRAEVQRLAEPERFCDDCLHFVPWSEREESKHREEHPPKFNPCTKLRRMRFKTPGDYHNAHGGGWGFHLPGCREFAAHADAAPEVEHVA